MKQQIGKRKRWKLHLEPDWILFCTFSPYRHERKINLKAFDVTVDVPRIVASNIEGLDAFDLTTNKVDCVWSKGRDHKVVCQHIRSLVIGHMWLSIRCLSEKTHSSYMNRTDSSFHTYYSSTLYQTENSSSPPPIGCWIRLISQGPRDRSVDVARLHCLCRAVKTRPKWRIGETGRLWPVGSLQRKFSWTVLITHWVGYLGVVDPQGRRTKTRPNWRGRGLDRTLVLQNFPYAANIYYLIQEKQENQIQLNCTKYNVYPGYSIWGANQEIFSK